MKTRLPGAHSVPIRRRDGGYCAEGPGFYVWDEDPLEVLRVARDLARGIPPRVPTQRLLIVPAAGRPDADAPPSPPNRAGER